MSESLRQHLPKTLAAACWCSHLQGPILTISVRDAQQATLLHCHQREILKYLNALYAERLRQPLTRVHVHVASTRPPAD